MSLARKLCVWSGPSACVMWTVTTSFRVTVIGVDLERCFSTGVSGFLEEDALSEPTVVDFRPSGAFLQRFRPAELRINFVDFPPLCFEFCRVKVSDASTLKSWRRPPPKLGQRVHLK